MKTIYLTKGLPASGKTTWALEKLKTMQDGSIKRINKDDLRAMLDGGKYSKGNEKFVLTIRDHIAIDALNDGKHVIIDDTNLDPKHEKRMREIAKMNNAKVEIVDFTNVSLEECIARDAKRDRPVGRENITKMYDRYLRKEGFTTSPLHQDESLPHAIICDLDGTLCNLNGRNPYDASTCENDTVNPVVLSILNNSDSSDTIIYVSGRSNEYRQQTMRWLDRNSVPDGPLMMRKMYDVRKDAVIKKELYEEHIKGKYYVEFVLDDRDQVVRMWRDMGLTCLQVNYGNF